MRIINLTPHQLVLVGNDGTETTVPTSGQVARVSMAESPLPAITLDGGVIIPAVCATFGQVEGLPAAEPETIFVVSGLVRSALGTERPDVFSPGRLRRGPDGQPNGCLALQGVAE